MAGRPVPDSHPWKQSYHQVKHQQEAKLRELRPILRARLDLRLDARTQTQLNDLIFHEGVNAAEIIRRAVNDRHLATRPTHRSMAWLEKLERYAARRGRGRHGYVLAGEIHEILMLEDGQEREEE